jgi:hypothetical protein
MKQQCMNIKKKDSGSGHPNYLPGIARVDGFEIWFLASTRGSSV